MLSGGIDSTAVLVKLLEETEDHIHAHHIYLKNRMGRERVELAAVYKIVEYCHNHYRAFDFTVSSIDLSFLRSTPPDIFHTNYIAGLMVGLDPRIKRLARCVIADDEEDETYSIRRDVARMLFRTLVPQKRSPEYIYPVKDMSKAEVIAYLPQDLLHLTWSCRTPQRTQSAFKRCGQCHTCQQIQEALFTSGQRSHEWLEKEVSGQINTS